MVPVRNSEIGCDLVLCHRERIRKKDEEYDEFYGFLSVGRLINESPVLCINLEPDAIASYAMRKAKHAKLTVFFFYLVNKLHVKKYKIPQCFII
jgi:hypothetical protein